MGVSLDSKLQKYAADAGVDAKDLNNKDKGKVQEAADKILSKVVSDSSASQKDITAALTLDAKAYDAANKKDKYSEFKSHVASATNNNSTAMTDLDALASSDGVSDGTAMAQFITALGNSVTDTMSAAVTTDGHHGKHDDQTTTIEAGGYKIEYTQVDDAYNKLKVSKDGVELDKLPDGMKDGGPGTYKLPNGAEINVGAGGAKANFSVTYKGQTQTVQYDGMHKGKGQNTVTMSGSASSGSAQSTSSTKDAQGRTPVSPMFVMDAEKTMAKAYGVDPDILSSAVMSTWEKPDATCPAKYKGKDAEAWQLGHQFALQYNNQGKSSPKQFSLSNMPDGWQGPTSFTTGKGASTSTPSGDSTTSGGSTTSGSAPSGGSDPGLTFDGSHQDESVTPEWVSNAMAKIAKSWGKASDSFDQGLQDAWAAQGAGGDNPSPPDFTTMTATQSKAYVAGWKFAEAYHAGSQSGSSKVSEDQISAFEKGGA